MHSKLAELLSLSDLERDRIPAKHADPRNIASFAEIEDLIARSLETEKAIPARATTPLANQKSTKPFQNDALLERILKYRDQIPLSSRIIRATDT